MSLLPIVGGSRPGYLMSKKIHKNNHVQKKNMSRRARFFSEAVCRKNRDTYSGLFRL